MRRHLVTAAVAGCLLLSCATPDAGRVARPADAAAGADRVPSDRQPTEDELSSAFEATRASPRPRADPTGNVPMWDPEADPLEGERAKVDPDLERQVSEPALAFERLRACGPERADACRRKAFAQLSRSAKNAPDAARWKKRLAAIADADACLRKAEAGARSGTVPACLDEAERQYRRDGDDRMVARVHLAKARAMASKEVTFDQASREYERAAAACEAPRCLDLRRTAMQQLAQLSLRRKDLEAAARAALRDVGMNAAMLDARQRHWAWTELATRTCRAWEAIAGEGRCRKLEQELTGAHHFRDFSRETSSGEGLSAEVVREVNAHFGFTLQPCLTQQAARLVPPAEERYEVRWVVRNDGRVIEMKLGRRDREDSPLARCLREKLATWRYPRFEGEYQNVEQLFIVTARAPLRAQ